MKKKKSERGRDREGWGSEWTRWEILISRKESKQWTSRLAYEASRLSMNSRLTLPALASSAVPLSHALKYTNSPFPCPKSQHASFAVLIPIISFYCLTLSGNPVSSAEMLRVNSTSAKLPVWTLESFHYIRPTSAHAATRNNVFVQTILNATSVRSDPIMSAVVKTPML